MKFCCEMMQYHATSHCPIHKTPFECPDWLIVFDPHTEAYGIVVHDGGHSAVQIQYCPWCGKALKSKLA